MRTYTYLLTYAHVSSSINSDRAIVDYTIDTVPCIYIQLFDARNQLHFICNFLRIDVEYVVGTYLCTRTPISFGFVFLSFQSLADTRTDIRTTDKSIRVYFLFIRYPLYGLRTVIFVLKFVPESDRTFCRK